MTFPTVNCVPVAMRAVPFELETTIEFGEKLDALVPPFTIGRVPDTWEVSETWPERLERERHEPPMAKQPPERFSPTLDVEVAKPEMFRPRMVVVPVGEISRAEMEVVANVVGEAVAT